MIVFLSPSEPSLLPCGGAKVLRGGELKLLPPSVTSYRRIESFLKSRCKDTNLFPNMQYFSRGLSTPTPKLEKAPLTPQGEDTIRIEDGWVVDLFFNTEHREQKNTEAQRETEDTEFSLFEKKHFL